MLDDRALTVDEASQHINRISVLKKSSQEVTWASRWGMIAALQVAEALVIVTSSSLWLAAVLPGKQGDTREAQLAAFGLAVAALVHFGLRSSGAYDFVDILHWWRSSRMAAAAWVLSTGPLLFIAFFLAPLASGRTVILGWLAGLAGIACVRIAAAHLCHVFVGSGWLRHNVLIIGTGLEAQRCAISLRADGSGVRVVELVPLDGASLTDKGEDTVPLSDLQRFINENEVKDIVVSTSFSQQSRLSDLIRSLRWLPVRVFLWPPSLGLQVGLFAKGGYRIGNVPLLLAGVPPLVGWHWLVKDVRDRVLAFLLLIFTSPVLLGIALMIRLTSPGPILFRQQREGYGGSMFTIFKFRTMRVSSTPTPGLILTEQDDPRVFPVGALLRKTSLDELPQLINVMRGDMWLVGPRPHSPLATAAGQRYSAAVYGYMSRLRVKPGITGWAQVNGWRGPTNTLEQIQQRLAYDLHYIEHLSLWLDLQILLKTAIKGFVHKNAY